MFHCIQAARDTGALKEAKDKLEKRVEELTWRLQIEKRLRVSSLSNIQIHIYCPFNGRHNFATFSSIDLYNFELITD